MIPTPFPKRWFPNGLFIFVFLLGAFGQLQAQDIRLANDYFNNGEFEKAMVVYEQLYKKEPAQYYFFQRYLESLMRLEKFDDAETVIKKQLKQTPKNNKLYVELGNLYDRQGKQDDAEKQYLKAIELLPPDENAIRELANSFLNFGKDDLALRTYQTGIKIFKNDALYAFEMAEIYRRKGETEPMMESYLNYLDNNPNSIVSVQSTLQRSLAPDDLDKLKELIYTRIQDNPDAVIYPEMLIWIFTQQKDYKNALRQAKSLDRKLEENGSRIYRLGQTAAAEKQYDAALEAFQYIIDEKGKQGTYYLTAKRDLLNTLKDKITLNYQYTNAELDSLQALYDNFLNEFGRNKSTSHILHDLAMLQAFYINNLDNAIANMQALLATPGITTQLLNQSKLDLGDFYLMKNEIWESTLLYAQVDKAMKDDMLGDEARFRNARLSYYVGDFDYAQGQLKILKASTSELISNDAIDLSVFIMEHYALDTTAGPMEAYANAELLTFQNRFAEAFLQLDSIPTKYPHQKMDDALLYAKAKLYIKKREYTQAVPLLQKIITDFPKSIKHDNALFELAQLFDYQLQQPEAAKPLYERILLEHSGSTFAVEARKRFRTLRNDNT